MSAIRASHDGTHGAETAALSDIQTPDVMSAPEILSPDAIADLQAGGKK